MAGISHLPEPILPLGISNQNTADARPIFRAAFDNLARWARRRYAVKPPASRLFKGSVDGTDAFIPVPDTDGHFAGGVRLPHVESVVFGRVAGAPLGRHTPLNPLGLDPFQFIGGTFTRFTDAELLARYPSRFVYVKRVVRAADHLVAGRYITLGDWWAFIAAAIREPLPCGPEDDDGNDLQRHAGCPESR